MRRQQSLYDDLYLESASALRIIAFLFPVHKMQKLVQWADRAETAERAESKEYPLFMGICAYVALKSAACENAGG
jgi:hypothetical protein